MTIEKFITSIKDKNIHVIGVSGSEGSNILRFLVKHGVKNITAHDYIPQGELEANFRLWHKGTDVEKREELLDQFLKDIGNISFYDSSSYLNEIEKAEIIFVPQSWRLYAQNEKLKALDGNVPFFTLTRMYLELSGATVIGVTGTVGKGSVSHLLSETLRQLGKTVYFGGNETWQPQLLDKLDEMKSSDILVLEISHRQLLDSNFSFPHISVITNLYPNHLDEVSWEKYVSIKSSLVLGQKKNDFAVLNYDCEVLRDLENKTSARVCFFSRNQKNMNTKSVQAIYSNIMSTKNVHYVENMLAVSTIIGLLGIQLDKIIDIFLKIHPLPARCEFVGEMNGVKIFNDIKSTTPWATLAAVESLSSDITLICGGKMKGIIYKEFFERIDSKIKEIICLKSELSDYVQTNKPATKVKIGNSLDEAIHHALKNSKEGDSILISPAAAFFYTDFVKGKKSIRKILTSLVQSGQK